MRHYTYLLLLILSAFNTNSFATLTLQSPAFQLNSLIPAPYTCNGEDKSPPLKWSGISNSTQSLTIIMEDPDAPNGVWTHWILFNIPPNVTALAAGSANPDGSANGKNSWHSLGYRGPCPPMGMHRYVFKLYALNTILAVANGADKDTVLQAITGHVIESSEWVGLYQK